MQFSLEQLQAFVAVYEQLSFSKAALTLNKHRTTIGQVITNLEDQLAVTLFDRIGRSVVATEDGELLYHYAKQALEQARVFDKVALSLSYGVLQNINIAYPTIIPLSILSEIRKQLEKDFPMMRVNFVERRKAEIQQGLIDGTYHFGLVNIHNNNAMNSFATTLLGHVEFIPFVQKGSPLSQLKARDVIPKLRNTRQFMLKSLIDEGMKDKMVISANHEVIDEMPLVIKLVQDGLGWAFLPKLLIQSDYVTENLHPVIGDELREGFKFPISLWHPHSKQITEIKKSMLIAITRSISDIAKIIKSKV